MCDKYLLSYYKEIVTEILKDVDETKHFSVNINFVELSGNDPNLGNNFLRDSEKSLEEWNEAIHKVQTNLMLHSEENYTFKKNIRCRIYSLPLYPELHRTKFPKNEDSNKFLQVSGTVVRITAVKMLEYQRQYICTKCKYVMVVNAEYDMKNVITPPKKCGNPEECKGTNIISMGELNAKFCKDYQEIKMQETVNKLDVGSMPNSIWVTLEDDLVDSCKPGDNVTVCGLIKRRYNQLMIGKKIDIELVIKANHVQVNNNNTSTLSLTPELKDMFQAFWKTYADTPLAARDIILKSICPQLFGLHIVKLALAVVLAGGSNIHNTSSTGVRVRAEPHILLVGDPGTGKSQLLRFASKIIPRSVLTTGVGSTAAGLTVTAVMENGEWQLEGGALVLSDGGICCIDEFNTMKEHDRTSIHEAMEQQTISVAKASIVCKLSTRCSILAATNPKGNLDPSQPLNMNVALASPLLSRFDLILLLRDTLDEQWDSQLVDYIFNSFDNGNSSKLSENINWTVETLQAYFAVIKKLHPVLTEDSNRILSGYYQAQRRKNYRNKSRTTVRLLDSLVRLSQGHARLMYHQEVEIVDAIFAVVLVETAMENESSVFNLRFNLRNDFPQDSTSNYRELMEIVLKRLDLHDLIRKELDRIDNNSKPSNRSVPDTEKSSSLTTGTKSKFFHIQNATEENIEQRNKISGEHSKQGVNKLISVGKSKKTDNSELDEGRSGIKIIEKRSSCKELKNIDGIEFKTKTNINEINTKTTKNDVTQQHLKEKQSSTSEQAENKKSTVAEQNNDIHVPEEEDINVCEKENTKFMTLTVKRNKHKNAISSKKMKLTNKVNEVHDVFNITASGLVDDDSTSLNFEQVKIDDDTGNIRNVAAKCPNMNKSTTRTISEERRNKNEKTRNIGKDTVLEQSLKVLSQRTRTKNIMNKFRFISKDTELTTATREEPFRNDTPDSSVNLSVENNNPVTETVSANNSDINDVDMDQFSEISFANVVSSTQSKKPNTSKLESVNPFESENVDVSFIKTKPSSHSENYFTHEGGSATDKLCSTKKFNFKKLLNSDNLKPQIIFNNPPSSIFESQEDIDSLDLDI